MTNTKEMYENKTEEFALTAEDIQDEDASSYRVEVLMGIIKKAGEIEVDHALYVLENKGDGRAQASGIGGMAAAKDIKDYVLDIIGLPRSNPDALDMAGIALKEGKHSSLYKPE